MNRKKNPPSNKPLAYTGCALVVVGSLTAFFTSDFTLMIIGDVLMVAGLVLCFFGYRQK